MEEWQQVVSLRLSRGHGDGPALRLSDLTELIAYQSVIREAARELWRQANPHRERLPAHFDDETDLRFTHLEMGSTAIPLEAHRVVPTQGAFFELDPRWVDEAIEVTWKTWRAAAVGHRPPGTLSASTLDRMHEVGRTLGDSETLEIIPAGDHFEGPAIIDERVREAVVALAPGRYEDVVKVVGHIEEADVRNARFVLYTEDGHVLPGPFGPEDEDKVTTALKEHRSVAVSVDARVQFEADGTPLRLLQVDGVSLRPDEAPAVDFGAPWGWLAQFGRERSVKGLPSDLAENIDHYLRGSSGE